MKANIIYPVGKYAYKDLSRIPSDYLIKVRKQWKKNRPDIYEYIKENMELLLSLGDQPVNDTQLTFVCDKIHYASENMARDHLKKIRDKEQAHNKPIRVYECEKCNQWHLTSWSIDEFKLLNK